MSEKTILKLYSNGDFEVTDAEFNNGNLIDTSQLIDGYIQGSGGIIKTVNATENKLTDYIEVSAEESYLINFTPLPNATELWWLWVSLAAFDVDYNYLGDVPIEDTDAPYPLETTWVCPSNVAYVRISATYFHKYSYSFKLNNLNPLSFSENSIIVPKIIKYDVNTVMPDWVQDTGNPISIFPEGIVTKGEIIIFRDDFNRADSSTLGENWIIESGGFSIDNNIAKPTHLEFTNNIAVVNVGVQDNVTIEVGTLLTSVSEGVLFRQVDPYNHFYAHFEVGNLLLRVRENNVNQTIAEVETVAISGNPYKMKIELRGAEIKIFVDDVLKITHTSNKFLNGTQCGIKAFTNIGEIGRFDNFEVRRLV